MFEEQQRGPVTREEFKEMRSEFIREGLVDIAKMLPFTLSG